MNDMQFDFLLETYLINFLEQKGLNLEALSLDEKIDMVMSDDMLSPLFSIYLIAQMRALIFDKAELKTIKADFYAKNN